MAARRRTVLLTVLALTVPLPAYAITDRALESVTANAGPAAIEVSTTLDSCGVLDDGVVCKLDVSFSAIPNAAGYTATVTRADGSVIDYGGVGAGGASLWVPYVGAGNYSVKITAYGAPDTPDDRDGRGEVIATGSSQIGERDHGGEPRRAEERTAETEVTGRDPAAEANPDPDGAATSEVGTSAATVEPACTPAPAEPPPAPPTPPVEPPQDLDLENPDEDADGIPDEQERIIYEQQLAEYQAAVATQAQAAPPSC